MEQILDKSDYITDKAQLSDYFYGSCKNRSDFRIGIEFERIGVDAKTFHAVGYSGKNGMASFLGRIKLYSECEDILEGEKLLGLKCPEGDITLEPGCQFEYSTRPFALLKDHEAAILEFNKKARAIGDETGITWLGYGIQPLTTFENIEMIPKERYKIMKNYLPKKGNHSPVMMMETAGVQASIDYGSEGDAMKKLRVALGISPVITAMFSNSPVRGGRLTGYKSYRALSWLNTDNDRCGLVSRKIFEEGFGFDDYAQILLDMPMLFIQRDNNLIDMTSMTFRAYMKKYRATMSDWMLHISTFFPDVRLKNLIEVRNCDSQKPDMALAFSALVKGILYNEDAMDAAWDLVRDFSWEKRNELRKSVPERGLAEIAGIAKELVAIAGVSLCGEAVYLEKLKELLSDNKTPADVIIMNWGSDWKKELKNLIHHTSL